MSCHEIAPLLELVPLLGDDAGAEGLLEAHERTALEQHLSSCSACRREADALSGAYAREAAAVEEVMQPLSPDLRERVLAGALKSTKSADVEAQVDPAAVAALRGKITLSCSFCHDQMERTQSVFCASCLAPHHGECFREHGRCSLPGCDETRTVRPSGAEPQPRKKAGVVISLAIALATGGAVAAAALIGSRQESITAVDPESDFVPEYEPSLDGGISELLGQEWPEESSEGPPELQPPLVIEDLPEELLGDAARLAAGLPPEGLHDPDSELTVAVSGPGRITLDADQAPLREVMQEIGVHSQQVILVDPYVDERVNLSLHDIPVEQAVRMIARMCRCEIEQRPSGILLLTQPPRVTIQFTDTDVRTVLNLCAAYAGKNIVLGPGVTGTVSVDFKEEHWRRAVHAIAANGGLHVAEPRPGLVLITADALPAEVLGWFDRPGYLEALGPPHSEDEAEQRRRQDETDAQGLSLDLVGLDLADACDELGRAAGRNILVGPFVEERVTLLAEGIHWLDAVDALATLTRCDVEFLPGGIVLLTQPPPFTLSLARCPSQPLYRMLGAQAGWNVVINRGVAGLVSADLKEIDFGDALRALAAVQGHAVEFEGDMLSITPGAWRVARTTPQVEPTDEERQVADLLAEIRRLAEARDADALEAKQAELRALVAGGGQAEPTRDEERIAAWVAAVEERFVQVKTLRASNEQAELVEALNTLRDEISGYAAAEGEADRERAQLEDWFARLGTDEAGLAIRLQLAITFGNAHLRGMFDALREERVEDALLAEEQAREIVRSLRASEHTAMQDTANELEVRVERLAERARVLKRIQGSDLQIQGILAVPAASNSADAAIVSGRRVREGQRWIGADHEETEIEVVEIQAGSVTFKLGETQFVRELGQ